MIHASEFLNFSQLDHLAEAGLISRRAHPTEPLFIYNYTNRCAYDKAWTAETLHCRGLILDRLGNVIARPFPKFFNFGEIAGQEMPGSFEVMEKLDGSLGIAYKRPSDGKVLIATRGSFESEQAKWATGWWDLHCPDVQIPDGQTWLFEIIYPENRIVVDYRGRAELVLLAMLDNRTGLDLPRVGWPYATASTYDAATVDELVARDTGNPGDFEGYVIRDLRTALRIKVKLDEYVRLHRLMTEVTPRNIWEILATGGKLDALLERVPDEFFEWAAGWEARLKREFAGVMTFAWSAMASERVNPRDRKATAEYFKGLAYTPVLFKLLDGKDPSVLVWKTLRPAAERGLRADIDTACDAPPQECYTAVIPGVEHGRLLRLIT